MFEFLAQSSSSSGDAAVAGMLAAVLIAVLIGLAVSLAIAILICFLLYSCQKALPAEHRRVEPGMIWLLLIPFFNYFWNFIVFLRMPESFKSFFDAHGRMDVGDCGRLLGQWYAILAVCSFAGSFVPIVSCVAGLGAIAALVLLIIFIVKMFSLKGEVERTLAGGGVPAGGVPPSAG